MNIFWNQQAMPQQNQIFQTPNTLTQFGGDYYTRMSGQNPQRFPSMMGGQVGLPTPTGFGQSMNGPGGGLGGGMPGYQGKPEGNPLWGVSPQSAGGQGYVTPGYPPQGFGQQQRPMPPVQGYPSQGFPTQGYPQQGYGAQVYNPGYGGQMPLYPAREQPQKGGIKGFISNLMAKRKR
ncbi:hypothetical protein [Desulfosporosinus sp. BG]|uniref:hypothetical protein n=1 Tax=Desulfosporosinus sp. BG TaxID=1633135 RepID=UPI00083A76E7|nr:hypothetical protein [Desulfosporosinus sp. BG]ODA38997.1 hypothetical protein DSBG_4223 [Desulfosporosinus sp. BG]